MNNLTLRPRPPSTSPILYCNLSLFNKDYLELQSANLIDKSFEFTGGAVRKRCYVNYWITREGWSFTVIAKSPEEYRCVYSYLFIINAKPMMREI